MQVLPDDSQFGADTWSWPQGVQGEQASTPHRAPPHSPPAASRASNPKALAVIISCCGVLVLACCACLVVWRRRRHLEVSAREAVHNPRTSTGVMLAGQQDSSALVREFYVVMSHHKLSSTT